MRQQPFAGERFLDRLGRCQGLDDARRRRDAGAPTWDDRASVPAEERKPFDEDEPPDRDPR